MLIKGWWALPPPIPFPADCPSMLCFLLCMLPPWDKHRRESDAPAKTAPRGTVLLREKGSHKWKVNNVMKAQPFKEFAVIPFSWIAAWIRRASALSAILETKKKNIKLNLKI